MPAMVPTLLPMPRQLDVMDERYKLEDHRLILLEAGGSPRLLAAIGRLQKILKKQRSFDWQIVASPATPPELLGMTLRIAPDKVAEVQGYRLNISSSGIVAEAHDEPGLYYAICTLSQILESYFWDIPYLSIHDWPDFPARGVMLDISRDKVPTMETLYALVDMFASWKMNQLQLYTENTFAYQQYPEAWSLTSPMTGQEILQLDAYCRERYVELVPNQNSFGHMERWLIYPRFAPLSEGAMPNMTLCATDPASLTFVASLFDELLPHFTSPLFNVGCDETQVGRGRSKEECKRRGEGRVYLDFLLSIYREVKARGRTMQFWGDIIMKYPEFIAELPRDVVAMEWGYSADHPFAENSARFAASGIPFYVCPGTSSWNSIAGRTDNALANMLNAAENGVKAGAIGYLNTDWGDRGHWQMLSVSYLPFAAGAAYSWCVESNRSLDMTTAAAKFAFRDGFSGIARVAYDLGNAYKAAAALRENSSILSLILQTPLNDVTKRFPKLTARALLRTLKVIDRVMARFDSRGMECADAAIIADEFRHTARLLRHACKRGLLALEKDDAAVAILRRELDLDMLAIIQEYARLWLARNRSGGLADSVKRLEKARSDYGWYPFDSYPC